MNRSVVAFGGHIGDVDLTAGPTLAKLVLDISRGPGTPSGAR
ncbi:hypothetical protein [Kribbella sp. VKM Ac-2568]|nr:hypothetical protein [Kribbella sp. VKM Ac-2568]TCM37491.1 hypothetical protein EV648_11940 [Kribbella sp. VKM Ac-2568]